MSQRLHFDVHEGHGPPLLLVHGFMSSRAQWLANLPFLKAFCTPVAVELWGHGRSPMPTDPALLSPQGYVAEFERIREAMGVSSWYIVGQSLGAGLTLRYALERPGSVWGQAFCNSNSALEDRHDPSLSKRGQALHKALMDGVPLRELPVYPGRGKRLPADVRAALVADTDQLDPMALVTSVQITRQDLSVRENFGDITVPTLLLNGIYEHSFQPNVNFARATLPGIEIVPLEGGHAVNAEVAEPFCAAIRRHFEAHKPR